MNIEDIIKEAVKEAVMTQMTVASTQDNEPEEEIEVAEAPMESLESNAKSGI